MENTSPQFGDQTSDLVEKSSSSESATAEGEGGPALAGGPFPAAAEALSVTRLSPFTNPVVSQVDWKPLACGVDSLDVGFQVAWNEHFHQFAQMLEAVKLQAAGTDGIFAPGGRYLVLPSGKPPNYRWHLQFPDFHLFIGRSPTPHDETPNVYASINAKALWSTSPGQAVPAVVREINQLGGSLYRVKLSRCDLAADFQLPGGIPGPARTLGYLGNLGKVAPGCICA